MTLQLFRTWMRLWSGWWQSGHELEESFFHRWRLESWGRVSWVALRANLNTCCGREWMDLAHVDAASGVAILITRPCHGRPLRFSNQLCSPHPSSPSSWTQYEEPSFKFLVQDASCWTELLPLACISDLRVSLSPSNPAPRLVGTHRLLWASSATTWLEELWRAREWHLGTFTLMPNHSRHVCISSAYYIVGCWSGG